MKNTSKKMFLSVDDVKKVRRYLIRLVIESICSFSSNMIEQHCSDDFIRFGEFLKDVCSFEQKFTDWLNLNDIKFDDVNRS